MRLAIRHSLKITKPELRPRAGYTLIEAFVVLMIIGLVASMVMPNWGKMGLETKANAAAGVLQADLQRAFNEAQKNKRPVRLVVVTGNRRYTVTDRATGTVIWSRFFTGTTTEFPLTGMTTSHNTIDFFPNGLASNNVTMTLTIRSETRTVTMSRVGHIRIS